MYQYHLKKSKYLTTLIIVLMHKKIELKSSADYQQSNVAENPN